MGGFLSITWKPRLRCKLTSVLVQESLLWQRSRQCEKSRIKIKNSAQMRPREISGRTERKRISLQTRSLEYFLFKTLWNGSLRTKVVLFPTTRLRNHHRALFQPLPVNEWIPFPLKGYTHFVSRLGKDQSWRWYPLRVVSSRWAPS